MADEPSVSDESEPDHGFFDLRNPWGVRAFLAFCVVSGTAFGVWHKYCEPQRYAAVAEVVVAAMTARKAHEETLARFPGLDDGGKADALEAGPLPLWSAALRRAEALQEDDTGGEKFFDAAASLRARETATRLLILTFREGDQDKLRREEAAWATGDRLVETFKQPGR